MAETRQITKSNWIESLRVLVPKFEINPEWLEDELGSQQIDFTLIDPEWLRREVEARGFHLKHQETHNVPDSQFWAALFQRTER